MTSSGIFFNALINNNTYLLRYVQGSDLSCYITVCKVGVFLWYRHGHKTLWQWWGTNPRRFGRVDSIATSNTFCLVFWMLNQDDILCIRCLAHFDTMPVAHPGVFSHTGLFVG